MKYKDEEIVDYFYECDCEKTIEEEEIDNE